MREHGWCTEMPSRDQDSQLMACRVKTSQPHPGIMIISDFFNMEKRAIENGPYGLLASISSDIYSTKIFRWMETTECLKNAY
jgi:hypothetical protein